MVESLFDKTADDSVILRVHVQPGAGRTAVVGTHGNALKLRVAAPPTGGRANSACTELLATTFGLQTAQVGLQGGESSRSKRFAISGIAVDDFARLLEEAIATAGAQPGRDGVHRASRH